MSSAGSDYGDEPEVKEHSFSSITNIRQTRMYDKIIQHVNNGNCTTPEKISFNYKGKKYSVEFDFKFSYDYSNGIDENGSAITDVSVTNIKTKTKKVYSKEHFRFVFYDGYTKLPKNTSDFDTLDESELVKYLAVHAVEQLFNMH